MKKMLIPMFTIFLGFACLAGGIRAYVPERQLESSFAGIWGTFDLVSRLILIGLALAAGLALLMALAWLSKLVRYSGIVWATNAENRRVELAIRQVELDRERAEAARAWRDASLLVTVAPINHQILLSEVAGGVGFNHKPAHLSPGIINGAAAGPSPWQVESWQHWQDNHATHKPAAALSSGAGPALQLGGGGQLQPVLPVLADKDCIMLVGHRGSGKTNILKHLVYIKRAAYDIILIDPHTPSKICGFDTIGAGGDWAAIESTLLSLEQLGRYRLKHPGDHRPIFLFVDEWRSVVRKIPGSAETILTVVHEFRKAQIDIALASQGKSVKALGFEGEGEAREAFTIVECEGYEGKDHKVFITPNRLKDRNGQRLDPVEYAPPPVFTGEVITPKEIFRLPAPKSPDQVKAEELRAEGRSYTFIAREIFGVDRASGPQINEVREMLNGFEGA